MAAFVVAFIQRIHDAETYKRYVGQVEPTLAPFGGRFLARRPEPERLEGDLSPSRAIILQFPSVEQARAWHDSPAYQPVMKLRQSASQGTLLLLPAHGAPLVDVGDVYYVEHVTRDVAATRRVLEETHGWRFEETGPELGGSLVATLPNGTRCGVRGPMDPSEKPLTRSYVRVRDIDTHVKRALALGAEFGLEPTQLGTHGTISIYFVAGVEHGAWQP